MLLEVGITHHETLSHLLVAEEVTNSSENFPLRGCYSSMIGVNDVMRFEVILPITIIIVILSPLVPNVKLRYYTCYLCYILMFSLASILSSPIILMRPRNVDNIRIIGTALKHFSKVIGIKWELRNGKVLRKNQIAVIIANHQSMLDTMGMFDILDDMGKFTVILKKELLYAIPFGPMAWLTGLVFVDRNNRTVARNNMNTAANVMKKQKTKLWIYPEGTRNKEAKDILPFKSGGFRIAIELGVPIIPIVFSPYYFIDSKNKIFSKGKIIISVLEPISTEGLTSNDIQAVKEHVHKLISDEFQKLKKETTVTVQQYNLINGDCK